MRTVFRIAVWLAIVVPLQMAFIFAALGRHADLGLGIAVILSSSVGPRFASLWSNRRYRRLPALARKLVDTVTRTGRPSGDTTLDQIALRRLDEACKGAGTIKVIGPVVMAVCIAAPLIAAVRVSPWWLLTLTDSAAVIFGYIRKRREEDVRVRRDRLRSLTQPSTPLP